MKLSVIIPCYNAEDSLGPTLEALAAQEWDQPWEVLVVDNRSIDGTRQVAESFIGRVPNLRIVEAFARQGRPYARNTGVAAAHGESIAFTDADDVVEPSWVKAMGEALEQHTFVACRMDDTLLNPPQVRAIRANNQAKGLQRYTNPPFLPHAGGSSLGIRRTVFEAVGGFDEAMLLLQDTDLCWRVQLAGHPLHFVPDATVQIRYRADLRSIFRQARNFGEYNWVLYRRYRPLGMPATTLRRELAGWAKVARSLLKIRGRISLYRFAWNFAWRIGRFQGMLRYGLRGSPPARYLNILRPQRLSELAASSGKAT